MARSLSRSDWGLAGDPVASIARIRRIDDLCMYDSMVDFGWRMQIDDASWQRSCYGWHFPDWFAVVGVRVKGEADSDWYLTARIHPGKGRRISVLDICRI